jgi:hypothetical protein
VEFGKVNRRNALGNWSPFRARQQCAGGRGVWVYIAKEFPPSSSSGGEQDSGNGGGGLTSRQTRAGFGLIENSRVQVKWWRTTPRLWTSTILGDRNFCWQFAGSPVLALPVDLPADQY